MPPNLCILGTWLQEQWAIHGFLDTLEEQVTWATYQSHVERCPVCRPYQTEAERMGFVEAERIEG